MELSIKSADMSSENYVSVSDDVFSARYNESLIHQIIVAYMAGARSGTRAHKSRSDVSGGGIKPWRQKGTGRARAGTTRGPIWRGGGKTFAATPANYTQKVNKKMYKGALRSIVSELLRQQRMIVIEQFEITSPKTRMLIEKLKALSLTGNVLMVVDELTQDIFLASRNLPNVAVFGAEQVDPLSLVQFDNVLVTLSGMRKLEARLS